MNISVVKASSESLFRVTPGDPLSDGRQVDYGLAVRDFLFSGLDMLYTAEISGWSAADSYVFDLYNGTLNINAGGANAIYNADREQAKFERIHQFHMRGVGTTGFDDFEFSRQGTWLEGSIPGTLGAITTGANFEHSTVRGRLGAAVPSAGGFTLSFPTIADSADRLRIVIAGKTRA